MYSLLVIAYNSFAARRGGNEGSFRELEAQAERHLHGLVGVAAVGRLRRQLRQELPTPPLLLCQRRPQPRHLL